MDTIPTKVSASTISGSEKQFSSALKNIEQAIAVTEAKKTGVDVAKVNKIIANDKDEEYSTLKDDLADEDNYDLENVSSLDTLGKYQNYLEGMEKASISIDPVSNKKQAKITISDGLSGKYFKTITKTISEAK